MYLCAFNDSGGKHAFIIKGTYVVFDSTKDTKWQEYPLKLDDADLMLCKECGHPIRKVMIATLYADVDFDGMPNQVAQYDPENMITSYYECPNCHAKSFRAEEIGRKLRRRSK